MVEFLESQDIEGATVLEIGGGVGEIHIELLKRGAKRALNLELSPAYANEAERLLREARLEERADWRLHDIAASPEVIEAADIVIMHRVVCCYPDYKRLLRSAGDHAMHLIVFSYPPRNPVSRLFIGAQNLSFRLLRKEFSSTSLGISLRAAAAALTRASVRSCSRRSSASTSPASLGGSGLPLTRARRASLGRSLQALRLAAFYALVWGRGLVSRSRGRPALRPSHST